jgi:hypothetical protein
MKAYNPESKTENVSKTFQILEDFVQKTLRHRVVQWMLKKENNFEDKFKTVQKTEDQLKNESFVNHLDKMVKFFFTDKYKL